MLALRAFALGTLRALVSVRIVALVFLAHLVLAALAAAPAYALFDEAFARSTVATGALAAFDPEAVADFVRGRDSTIAALLESASVAAVAMLLLNVFLLGGVIASLADPRRPRTFTTFFSSCGRTVFPFARVWIPAGLVLALLALLNDLTSRGLTAVLEETLARTGSDFVLGVLLLAKTLLFAALFVLLVWMPVQFARVRCVVDDDRSMLRGYLAGVRLAGSHPLSLLLLALLFGALWLGVPLLWDALHRTVDPAAVWRPLAALGAPFDVAIDGVAVLVLVNALLPLLFTVLLVARTAAFVRFYREVTAPPEEPDPELVYSDATDEEEDELTAEERPSPPRAHVVDAPAPRTGGGR